ncbi:LamG-like jellyroll fold domain-containing protein [Pontiella sulfatireligans]|uniref:Rhamnogalacturonase A/B/Epimerase-like pectate lyase domain-containing protein n=1 Tax=Pontiella sulfatireligans TaxID=2750658 RepID=A0A6C2UP06_9BACT|nr:LamG-like jellyroll fold domain-containing protein [Pontiella sulfatireligans]VGO21995.1 hypothetical protein SCARR_04075 [Pontiella sulfatireligans]
MRTTRWIATALLTGLALFSEGGITTVSHRYLFDGDVTDSVGALHGTATTNSTYLEAPQFINDIPAGTVAGAPTQSIEFGMNNGSKKSGFSLGSVMGTNIGSYSLWFKSEDVLQGSQYLVASWPQQILKGGVGAYAGGIEAGFQGVVAGGGYATNEWIHVVVSWDNTAAAGRLYINGVLAGTADYDGNVVAPSSVNIGGFNLNDDGDNLVNQSDVKLYDLQFYDGMLDAGDVFELHNNPGAIISYESPVLAHRYAFGSNVDDSIGSADGTATTNGTYTEAPLFSTDIPSGAVAGAPTRSLQVGMSYLSKKSGFSLGSVMSTNTGSYSLWFKSEDVLLGSQYLVVSWPQQILKGGIGAYAGGIEAGFQGVVAGGGYATNEWIHVVVSWDNTAAAGRLYINGVLAGTADYDGNVVAPSSVNIGGFNLNDDGDNLANQSDVKLYDLQFYRNELGIDAVQLLYANPGIKASHDTTRLIFPTLDESDAVVADLAVTDAPYNADSSGVSDCTAMVQAALDDLGSAGGGTLYFPAGKYRFDGTLTVPGTISLRGDWKSPLDGGSGQGTILMVYAGRNDTNAAPFIQFSGGLNAIQNLSFWYPEQTVDNVVPYPPTIQRKWRPCMLKRLTFYNAYQGYEVEQAGGAPVISEIFGTFLNTGIKHDNCLEYGFFDQIHISPSIWADAPSAVITNAPALADVRNWCQANTVGLELLKNDDIQLFDITVENAKIGLLTDTNASGMGATYGFKMKINATLERRYEGGGWVGAIEDLDRFPETAAVDYVWPDPWKPARSNVLINVREYPYSATGDGVTDDRQAIQDALDDAGVLGGGIVYLPAGEYVVRTNLLVPSGVELRGVTDFVYRDDHGPGASPVGTALFAFHGENSVDLENEPPFISLSSNSSVRGMTILYPNQGEFWPTVADDPPKTYPWTIRGLGPDINIQYVTIKRGWNLIDLASHDCSGFVLQDFWTSPLNIGVRIGGGTDGGHIQRVLQSMGAWSYPGINTPDIPNWTSEIRSEWLWTNAVGLSMSNSVGYVFGDVKNVQAYGAISFMFKQHMQFLEQDGNGPENMDFFMCHPERTAGISLHFDRGNDLRFFGIGIVSFDDDYFLETTPNFTGTVDVYGLMMWGDPTGRLPLIGGGEVNIYPQGGDALTARVTPTQSQGLLKRLNFEKTEYADKVVTNTGRECWSVSPVGTTPIVDLRVDWQEFRFGNAPEVEFSFDYLDVGADFVQVYYDAHGDGNCNKLMGQFNLTDTGQWKTWTATVTDALFADRMTYIRRNDDILIQANTGGAPFYVSRVELTRPEALSHRYRFEGGVTDSIGSVDGEATTNGTWLEAPLLLLDVPPGAVAGAPTNSLRVGMGYPSVKSGFRLEGSVMNTNAGSYSLWFKSEDVLQGSQYLVASWPQQILKGGIGAYAGGIEAGFQGEKAGSSYAVNEWNHAVVSWDNATGTGRLYLNGALAGTTTYSNRVDTAWINIGGFNLVDNDAQLVNQFDGILYDLQFYNRTLSSDTVKSLYRNPGSYYAASTANRVPRWWLDAWYPGVVDYEASSVSDTDVDGYDARAEYFTGSDPTDVASLFEIADAQTDGDGLVITWISEEGCWFSLSAATNLASEAWSPIASAIPGQHGFTSYTTTVESAACFYKVNLH